MGDTRWKTSVTVAAIVERDGRYLVVEEHTPEGLRLNNPAGHLDPGETPLEGVVRETLEETGRRFTPQWLLGVYLSRARRAENGADVTFVRLAFGGEVGRSASRCRAARSMSRSCARCGSRPTSCARRRRAIAARW
jgi:8-oxo-dGTP pyrophosphatase MutT (NUDIX family)